MSASPLARRVRLTDVAARANVSITAVSLALNDRPGVSDTLRQHIRDVAEDLGYRVDRRAASLRSGRTETLGLVVRNVGNPHYAKMVAVIEERCAQAGLGILVAASGFDPARERAAVQDLLDRGIDLLAVTPVGPLMTTAPWGPLGDVPVIFIDADFEDGLDAAELDSVWSRSFDIEAGMGLAADHLAGLGHRRISLLSTAPHPTKSANTSFLNAVEAHGATGEIVVAAAPSVAATYDVVSSLLKRPAGDRPTAIVFRSDDTALAGYMAAKELGLRIPEDLSIIGAGALRTSAFLNPALTTLNIEPSRMGESVADLIIDIHNTDARVPRHHSLDTSLILGNSTSTPPH